MQTLQPTPATGTRISQLLPCAFRKKLTTAISILVGILLSATTSTKAQQIYLQTFNSDDSANWAINFSYTAPAPFASLSNNLVNFNFDYTTLGIPIAPHSALFGSADIHHGLKLSPVYTNVPTGIRGASTAGLSVTPLNFSVSQNFIMHADMWINMDCTAYPALQTNNVTGASYATSPHNSTASTVFYGCGYGTAGTVATTPGVTDAIFVGAMTDDGVAQTYRMYGPSTLAQISYQDGVYQSTGTTTPGFPGDPLVYNTISSLGAGTRNWLGTSTTTASQTPPLNNIATNPVTGKSWGSIFPPSVVPLAQQILYPQQTNNASCPGLCGFAWRDVSLEKVGNVIIYKIDGNIIATGNYSSAGTPAGNLLTFMASRVSLSAANAVSGNQYTNLNFVVFANIVVSNYDNLVSVSAPIPQTQEGQPDAPAMFTITRSSAGVPLTVTYTLTGNATNGVQYQTLPTSITFSSTDTSTNLYVVPIDDGIPNPTTTVALTLQSGSDYVGAGSAIVNILDGDTPTIDLTGTSQAYGRYTGTIQPGFTGGFNSDFLSYTLTRRGKLTTGSDLNINLSYSGSAVAGIDFTPPGSITFPDGAQSAPLLISPAYNPSVTTNRSVTITVAAGSGYAVGTGHATGTIVSANYPPAPVLLSDPLTDSSAAEIQNWNVIYGTGDVTNDANNFSADFGMNLSSAGGGIPIPPPPSGNGNALHLTCNKNNSPTTAAPGAVNVYYTNLFLSGDYAVRFSMNLIEGEVKGSATEGAIFGINHTGTCSNWWYGGGTSVGGPWTSDGVWYYVTAQPLGYSAGGDYAEYTGTGGTNNNPGWTRVATQAASAFAPVFKVNPGPFTVLDANGSSTNAAGQPANSSPALGYDASTWSDVEMKQQHDVSGNLIDTLSINHTVIFTYTNRTVWTNGYLMLGYADPFGGSVGTSDAGVYYANLQVVQLPSLVAPATNIKSIKITGGNVLITFSTTSASDTISSFTLTSSGAVNGTYSTVGSATITSLGANQFQVSTPYPGSGTLFYRISHN